MRVKHAVPLLLLPLMISGCAVQYDPVNVTPAGDVRAARMTLDCKTKSKTLEAALIALDPRSINPQFICCSRCFRLPHVFGE